MSGIKYKDLIELGFERVEDNDPVFFDQYGYKYFFMLYIIEGHNQIMETEGGIASVPIKYLFDWCPDEPRRIDVYKVDQEDATIARITIRSKKLLIELINLLKAKS
jgi:hypothetical protein